MPITYEEIEELRELTKGLTYEEWELISGIISKEKREEEEIIEEPKELLKAKFREDIEYYDGSEYWTTEKVKKWELHNKLPQNWLKRNYPQWKNYSYETLKAIIDANYNQSKVRYWVMKKLITE